MNSTTEQAPASPATPRVAETGGSIPPGKRRRKPRPAAGPNRSFRYRLRRDKQMLIMMVPALLSLLLFFYIPVLGNVIAFQDYQPFLGIGDSLWVGWQNFTDLFANPDFVHAFWNTLYLAAWQLVFLFPIPLALALIVDSLISMRVRKVFQSIAYLPHFLSWVLVIAFFQQMLGGAGFINNSLRHMGFDPIPFMTNPDTFPILVVVQMIWKDAGWAMIIFLAALASIDNSLYEAAAADGAGRWRRMWHITLPGLRAVIVLLLILRIGDILSVGFEQFILQRDAVGPGAAEVLDTFIYHAGIIGGSWSPGAAAGLAKGVVSMLLIYAANKLAHKFGEDGIFARKVG